MYQLEKTFRFESSHRLVKNYCGKCANMHGHSWNGSICISGDKLDKYDMLVDFNVLKIFLKQLEEDLDHVTFLHEEDTEFIEACNKTNSKHVIFKENPTSETLSKYIYNLLEDFLNKNANIFPCPIKIEFVQVDETCTSSCRYYKH